MKMIIICLISAFISLPVFSMTGLEVATKVYNSNRTATSIQKAKMTLISKSGGKKERVFYTLNQDNNKYDSKSLIVFTVPKKFRETAMLTHNEKGTETNQWLYLPALKKSRRISSGKKSGRFVGSDLTYEDLEDREPELDNHKILKETTIKGKKYIILESTAKNSADSIYSKVISWVDAKDWVVKQAKFYKRKKNPVKSLIVKDFKVFDKALRGTETVITHHEQNHKTVIELLSSKDDVKLSNNFFSKRVLENQTSINSLLK